jgi:hypothetical protein
MRPCLAPTQTLEAAEQIQAGDFVDGQELLSELRSRAKG